MIQVSLVWSDDVSEEIAFVCNKSGQERDTHDAKDRPYTFKSHLVYDNPKESTNDKEWQLAQQTTALPLPACYGFFRRLGISAICVDGLLMDRIAFTGVAPPLHCSGSIAASIMRIASLGYLLWPAA